MKQSETTNGMTDNTKEKGIKRKTIIYKTLHRQPKIKQHEPHKKKSFSKIAILDKTLEVILNVEVSE